MDPYNKNTPKMKEGIKKIIKIKKGLRLILDEDEKKDVLPHIKPMSKPIIITDKSVTKTQDRIHSSTGDVFSESKAFDVLQIEKKTTTKREGKKEMIPSEKKVYTKDNVLFNLDKIVNKNFDSLHTELQSLPTESGKITMYNICYTIRYDGMKPYLMYYLFKYPKSTSDSSDLMIFPFKSYKKGSGTTASKTLKAQSMELNRSLFSSKHREKIIKEPLGYLYKKDERSVFVFYLFNFDREIFEPSFAPRKQQFWWCMIDELVNYKKVLNFPVSSTVSKLLLEHTELCKLYYIDQKEESDVGSELIETPSVGYHGTYYDLLPLIVSFGLRPSTLYPMMGPYYYFGTFRKAVRYAGWTSTYKPRKIGDKFIADENGLYEKGGIVRFALFLGKTKAFLNLPYDDDDRSERYYNRIKLNPGDKSYEDLTLKLHDHNGKWSKDYDSAYVGRSRLANGGLFMKNSEFITRDFEQQNILTYHELDKETLVYDRRRRKVKWDPNYNNYQIK
jgi:hypothetical protein